jgi:phospholipid/cholesterol/gamma-HCH transport system substrate-binding protein
VRTVKVGLLVAVALALFMATVFMLGAQQRLWERKVVYEIHFARAGGLQEGAPVSLTGVSVGSVADMRFPDDPTAAYIEVLVNVASEVAPRIREDTVATIRTYGLLGDRYIELSGGSPDRPAVPAGGILRSIDPIDYEAVLGQSGDIASNIVEVTASLKDVLGSIQRGEGLLGAMVRNRELGEATLTDLRTTMANVQATTRSLEQILARIERGEGLLGRLTRRTSEGDELVTRAVRATRSLERFARRLERGQGALPRLVEDEAYARRLLGNLDRAIGDLAAVADKLERGQGTLGKLVNDPSLYRNAEGFFRGARRSWLLRLFGLGGAPAAPEAPAAPPPTAPAADRPAAHGAAEDRSPG